MATGVAAILAGTIAIASVYQSKAIEADRRSAQVRQEKELLDDNAMLDADFEAAQKLAKEGKLAEADALFRRWSHNGSENACSRVSSSMQQSPILLRRFA